MARYDARTYGSKNWLQLRHRKSSGQIYGNAGSLQVRLASSRRDVRRAQRLRYEVFYEEMSAKPSPIAKMRRLDSDRYDAVCDHLLVVNNAPNDIEHASATYAGKAFGARPFGPKAIVRPRASRRQPLVAGTYRVLREDVARRRQIPFYTQSEYNVAPLLAAKGDAYSFMELGRSCVLPPYRNKRTVELLWHGLWTYVRQHSVDVMFGCASFEGVDPQAHAMALSFLHHNCRAPEEWSARAHDELYQTMNLLPADEVDAKAALKGMPPLIKAYLRLGAYIGDGAVVDHSFGTTDVLIILPVERIDPRYFAHFGAPDEKTARIGGTGAALQAQPA